MIEAQSVPVAWGTQRYRRTGKGKAFVLVHPLALSSRLWEPIIEDFLPGHDLVMPDVRGHGDSHWDGTPYTIEDIARDMRALLDALGINRCSMLGMSMGGCVAMTFAAENPDRVERLLLCDTTAWYGAEAPDKWRERAHTAMTKTRGEQIPFQTERWFSETFRREHADIAEHAANVFRSTSREAHAAACRALGQFDLRDRLAAIRAKTLVVTGEGDYATPPAMGRALAEAIPGATFALVPYVRHMAVLESAVLRQRLRRFAAETSMGEAL